MVLKEELIMVSQIDSYKDKNAFNFVKSLKVIILRVKVYLYLKQNEI